MSKIKTLNVKRCVAVFMAVLITVLSLSYTDNSHTDATNTRRQYYVYNAKTGVKIYEYYLDPVEVYNNSRTVVDTDDRNPDKQKNGVVKIITHFANYYNNSGFVVGDHVIATAAHCVCGDRVSKILLFNENGEVVSEATPVEYHVPAHYAQSGTTDKDYDYALITVKEDLHDYAKFELGVPLDSFLDGNADVTVTGFPDTVKHEEVNDTENKHMIYSGVGQIYGGSELLIYYTADASHGNSGGPVYITESFNDISGNGNNKTYYTVLGINTNSGNNCNIGIRMTTDLIHFYKNNPYLLW